MYFRITGTLMGSFRRNNSWIVLVDKRYLRLPLNTRKQFCIRIVYMHFSRDDWKFQEKMKTMRMQNCLRVFPHKFQAFTFENLKQVIFSLFAWTVMKIARSS